ncbi:MAG: 4Fe-4S ferredoxin, partial [Candidatus Lokiarchaeota archaeon]|nr:4Fe-4S ferredoxin [Candidatus Lokiarchaeota archaeon]
MSNSDEIYTILRERIDNMPVGMPKTGSGVEITFLKQLFTPEEAEIAIYLSILPEKP